MHLKTRGTLEMTAAMLISGTVGWFVLAADQPAAAVVFWRCLFGALALLLACAGLGLLRRGRISWRQALAAAVGGVALVLNWVLLFSAYGHASIAVSTVVYHTQPFMLVGLGMLLFAEKMTANKASWLLAAFAGMLLIVMAGSSADAVAGDYRLGVLMALGAAFFYAIAAVITKRLHGVAPQLIVLIQMLVGVGLLAPFAQVPGLTRAPATWAWLATIGIVHTGLMSTLLYSA
ncbi:DMT family transporter, partial [Pseudomonas frederiksbergensis]|nr:DMT family transporter [Pseudomonas frederiksbergensis]